MGELQWYVNYILIKLFYKKLRGADQSVLTPCLTPSSLLPQLMLGPGNGVQSSQMCWMVGIGPLGIQKQNSSDIENQVGQNTLKETD